MIEFYLILNLIYTSFALITDEGALEIAETVKNFSGVTSAVLGLK